MTDPTWQPDPKVEKMIRGIARRTAHTRSDIADFIQEGMIAAWKVEQSFDPDGDGSLATASRAAIKHAIWKAAAERYSPSLIKVPVQKLAQVHVVEQFGEGAVEGVSDESLARAELAQEGYHRLYNALDDFDDSDSDIEPIPELAEVDYGFEEAEEVLDLHAALEEADLDRTQEIILHLIGTGCTDEEIGQRLGIHRTTITRKKESALQELRRHMKEEA